MAPLIRIVQVLLLAAYATAQTAPAGTGVAKKPQQGPYASIAALITEKEKKPKFFALLKQMREEIPKLPEAERSEKRRTLNSDMQKLLGDEMYQKYRAVRTANTAKAKGGGSTGAQPAKATGLPGKAGGKGKGKGKGSGKKPSAAPTAPA